jgi:hypothetical protein
MHRPDDRAGSTSHRLVGLALPMIGARYALDDYLGVDLMAYTALSSSQTQTLVTTSNVNGCSQSGNKFSTLLPCEGNATLSPVLAFAPTLTVTPGPNFSAVSVGPTFGWARTNQDSAFHFFGGLMVTVGAAQLSVPVKSISKMLGGGSSQAASAGTTANTTSSNAGSH